MMLGGEPIPGQTPLPDLSGLRDPSIRTVSELNACEAENIRRAVLRYLASRPTPRAAPFDEPWLRALHQQMFGDVWAWAGSYLDALRAADGGDLGPLVRLHERFTKATG